MKALIAILPATLVAMAPTTAEAEVINEHPAYWVIVGLGTVGGLASSIAALVYAAEDLSFDTPWVVATVFSASICAVWTGQLLFDAGQNATIFNVGGAILYAGLTAWPTAWMLLSALSDVEPGEPLNPGGDTPSTDPIEALRPTSPATPTFPLAVFSL